MAYQFLQVTPRIQELSVLPPQRLHNSVICARLNKSERTASRSINPARLRAGYKDTASSLYPSRMSPPMAFAKTVKSTSHLEMSTFHAL